MNITPPTPTHTLKQIPGGELNDSRVINGVMFNKVRRRWIDGLMDGWDGCIRYVMHKSTPQTHTSFPPTHYPLYTRALDNQQDVTHSKMRRRIEKPRILLLDCPLEYKKGESQANVEVQQEDVRADVCHLVYIHPAAFMLCVWSKAVCPRYVTRTPGPSHPQLHTHQDWNTLLRMEEEFIEKMCAEIVAFHPDIVITEKGVSGAWAWARLLLGWGLVWIDVYIETVIH